VFIRVHPWLNYFHDHLALTAAIELAQEDTLPTTEK
jgi:hypothetical protein